MSYQAPPPPPAPPPPGGSYGQPGGYQPAPANSGKSVAILVLGIVGLVLSCGYGVGIVPAIVALALAPGAKREIAASQGGLGGESFIKAGVICSWVTIGLVVVAVLAVIAVIIIVAATSNSVETTSTSVQSSVMVWVGR